MWSGVNRIDNRFNIEKTNHLIGIIGYSSRRIHKKGLPSITVMGFLRRLIYAPIKIMAARKHFKERFGPAFFMRPNYCVDCKKNPIKIKDADLYAGSAGMNPEDPICPECNWVMNVSSWDRFMIGFLDGSFTLEEFEEWERKTYMNEDFVNETLNQNG